MKRRPLTKREEQIIAGYYFTPHYSGDRSRKFWREVEYLIDDGRVYVASVVLKDMELRVLAQLNAAIRAKVRKLVLADRHRQKGSKKQKRRP